MSLHFNGEGEIFSQSCDHVISLIYGMRSNTNPGTSMLVDFISNLRLSDLHLTDAVYKTLFLLALIYGAVGSCSLMGGGSCVLELTDLLFGSDLVLRRTSMDGNQAL